ncbi:hypothetical protein AB0F25_34280 [Streptomyces wedmorensis]|uniref:hypothetical protein n=1 Tax=Streptomyces wedmorensis TaxID=43759 RepID=UPI00341E0134
MHHSDAELLDFDTSELGDWDEGRAQSALNGQSGELYRNHLHIAMHLSQWAERETERTKGSDTDELRSAGFVHALEEVAAHLRQTDYLPGSDFLGPV